MTLSPDTLAFIRTTTDDHPFPIAASANPTMRAQLVALRTEVLIYRNMLLKICRECAECGGTGLAPRQGGTQRYIEVCPVCKDIREILK